MSDILRTMHSKSYVEMFVLVISRQLCGLVEYKIKAVGVVWKCIKCDHAAGLKFDRTTRCLWSKQEMMTVIHVIQSYLSWYGRPHVFLFGQNNRMIGCYTGAWMDVLACFSNRASYSDNHMKALVLATSEKMESKFLYNSKYELMNLWTTKLKEVQ